MKKLTLIEVDIKDVLGYHREEKTLDSIEDYLEGEVYIERGRGLERLNIATEITIRDLIYCKFYYLDK